MDGAQSWMDKENGDKHDEGPDEWDMNHVFECPGAAKKAASNYAFDSRLSRRRMEQIEIQSSTKMFYDSSKTAHNSNDPGTSLPHPGFHDFGYFDNVAYADGHVKALRMYPPGSR